MPELEDPNTRELFVQRYRLIYEVHRTEIHVLAFLHGARDLKSGGARSVASVGLANRALQATAKSGPRLSA